LSLEANDNVPILASLNKSLQCNPEAILHYSLPAKIYGCQKKTVSEVFPMDLEGISPLHAASGDPAAHHPTRQRMPWKAISVADDT
jgi:hypothetical protein